MMIPAAFLVCALAVPMAFVPSKNRHYDVTLFHFMARHYRTFHPEIKKDEPRAYMMGGDDDLLFMLRKSAIESWRVTIEPHTPYDVVAFADRIPFARESSLVMVYLLTVKMDRWGSMKLWSEATAPLMQGGIIAFYDKMAPHFPNIAKAQGWEYIPTQWYNMSLWRKPRPYRRYRLTQMRSS